MKPLLEKLDLIIKPYKKITKSIPLVMLLFFSTTTFAQVSGGNAFLVGNYVEVGIAGQGGYEGADLGVGTLPGIHWRSDIGNNLLGFVADPTMSGWVNFDGDFFTPGVPENGWGFEVGSVSGGNNGYSNLLQIPGSVTNWSNTNGCIQVDWHGDYTNSGLDLSFDIIYKLNENELFYTTEVYVTNNSSTTLNDFYYYRNIDPDNNEVLNGDYSTTNSIVSQPNPSCSKALVSATQNMPWTSYLGLAAIGDNFRVSYGGFSNRDASDIWNGVGVTNAVGSQFSSDEAISLAYKIPILGPNETKSFKFIVILDAAQADNALNSLFYFDYNGSIGAALPECSPEKDTATICTSMSIAIGIQGNALNDFNWQWTPSTGLSSTTGTSTVAQPSVTTTYTITGTPVNPCYTTTVTKQIVVTVLLGPDAQYVDPGLQCGNFDLSTLVHSDANLTLGAIFNFYSTPPTAADDTNGIITPGIISQGDSVWIVYADTSRGCFDAEYIDIQWGSSFSLNIDIIDASCGQANGSANVLSVNGGTAPYTYQWSSGPGTPNYDNIGFGQYTIIVTDSVGCSSDSTIQINQNSTLSTTVSQQNISCFGLNDGMGFVEITGGIAPYIILWDDIQAQQTDTAFNLSAGSFSVQVTDSTGCITLDTILIVEPAQLSIIPVLTNLSCFGECDGEIIAAPLGGTPYTSGSAYHYLWNTTPTQTTSIATGLCVGSHTVSVSDANGCALDSTFTLTQPLQFTYSTDSQNASCGASDGWAAITNFSGGNGSYSYQWDANAFNQTSDTAFNLASNTYSVTITDTNGCDTAITVTVGSNVGFTIAISNVTPTTCFNGTDGTATISGSDPLAIYTYNWGTTPIQITQTAVNLEAGTYYVSVTDQTTGCTNQDSVTISEPNEVTISTISSDTTICSSQSTTITAIATGGLGTGYIYTWNQGLGVGQNQTVSPSAGTSVIYQVTAVDGNNCPSTSNSVTVTVNPNLTLTTSVDSMICPKTSTIISAYPSQGNGGPYYYSWTPNQAINNVSIQNPTVSPLINTVYFVTVSDGCSPTITDSVIISLWDLPQPTIDITDNVCIDNGNITFYNTSNLITGMIDTNTIDWFFGDGNNSTVWDTITHHYNQPGIYSISMAVSSTIAQGGCRDTVTLANVEIYPMPIADFISEPNVTTMFATDIQFFDQSGSNINYHHWNFAGLDTSNNQHPLYTFSEDTIGNYAVTLTVTDINGCIDSVTKEVIIKGEFGIFIPNAFTPDFNNTNDLFGPKGFGISPENYHFMIFDKWGEKLFDSDVLYEGWDGFFKGTRVQQGIYVWKLTCKDYNKQKHELIGHVTIIE